MKNKKNLAVLSSAAIGTLILAAVTSTNAYAAADGYLVQDKDNGKYYKYDLNELVDSMIDETDLFKQFSNIEKTKLIAIHDDKLNAYVDLDKITDALVDEGEEFNLDKFTETASIEDQVKVDKTIINLTTDEEGNVIEIKDKENLKVESVSAINETSVQVTGLDKEVKEDALKDSKITLKAGEENLTATYVQGSLTEGKANFVLANEKKLSDAVTYTVASENFNFAKDTFMAKVKAAYIAKVEVSTKIIPENNADEHNNIVRFTAKNQYSEDLALIGENVVNLHAKGIINGVPFKTDEINETNKQQGQFRINRNLVEGDKITLTLTNTINGKDVEVGTVSYVVAKHKDSVATTISNMKATYKDENGRHKADKFDNVLPADQVDLKVDVNDQFGNPMVAGTQVRWVVEEGKDLITKTSKTDGTNYDAIEEVSDAATFSFRAVKAGKLKISAYNVANGEKQTFETVIGANKLTELNLAIEAGAGSYNKDENIVKIVTPNNGANLTADQIKFDVKAAKTTVDVTPADVQVSAKVRGGKEDNKNDIVIVVKTDKPGKYTITPYVGESLEKATAKVAAFDVTTTVDQTVASIDDINFDASELKVGSEIKKDITFKNKHGEVVVVDGVKVKVTPDIADAAKNAKVTTEVENGVSKNVLNLKLKDAKTYNVVINKKDVFKAYNLKFVGAKFTSINAGANVTGVVAGDVVDKAKYQEVKFLDQDGKAMDVKKEALKVSVTKPDGQDLGEANLAQLITLGKTYSVDEHGVVNFAAAAEADNVIAYKISPAAGLKQGIYTVKIADKDNKISDTFTVTVGAERVAKTVEVTTDSTNVALNGQTELKIVPKDQYGEFIVNDNIEVVGGDHFAKEGAITPIQEKGVTIGYKAVVKGTSKGTNDVVVNVMDKAGEGAKAIATNKVNMTVDSVAGLINSVEIDKEGIQPAYSTEKAGIKVRLKAIAKDAKGQVVPVDAADLSWEVVAVDGKVGDVAEKATIAEAVNGGVGKVKNTTGEFEFVKDFNGTATVRVLTANMKSAEITLTCDRSAPAAQKGTTNVLAKVDDKVLDGDKDKKDIQVLLDGKDADGEENGAVVVKVVAKDQFGKDFNGTDVTEDNTTVMVGDSSIVDAKVNGDHTITLTSKAVGKTDVNVIYNGDTVKLEVSVNKEAAKAAEAKAEVDKPIGVVLGKTQETEKGTVGNAGTKQVSTLKVLTGAVTKEGKVSVLGKNIDVEKSDSAEAVAGKITSAFNGDANWTVTNNKETLTFKAKEAKANAQLEAKEKDSSNLTGVTFEAQKDTTPGKEKPAKSDEKKEVGTTKVTHGADKAGTIKVKVADGTVDKTVDVDVAKGDSAEVVAGKIKAALAADDEVKAAYTVTGDNDNIVLTQTGATQDVNLQVTLGA